MASVVLRVPIGDDPSEFVETGLIFAKGSAEATFTVALTWRKPALAMPDKPGTGDA